MQVLHNSNLLLIQQLYSHFLLDYSIVQHAMRQLLLLALLLLSSLHLSSSSRNGRGLQQARTQYFNAGWTIRGYCGATFLNGFETKLAEATKTDIQAYTKAADVTLVSTSECQEAQAVRCYSCKM